RVSSGRDSKMVAHHQGREHHRTIRTPQQYASCTAARARLVRPQEASGAPMPRIALFPGSFDPVTNGHLDLVRQSARLADRLVLAIGTHPGKTPLFTAEERLAMLTETCGPVVHASGCEFACVTFAD